ncbi:MAG: GDSL-type esterase/lipase family protein [Pseudonocardia sp.]|nr:GDSL-type esterase/lipase family protein [Pseudonocardia sp.]
MPRRRRLLALLAAAAVLVATVLLSSTTAAAAPDLPAAVVALGDSAASGEGAGDYEPGTRGEDGNWCHRSSYAYIHRTGLTPESVNLACSGAGAGDVAFGDSTHNTETSQARALVDVAGRYRVETVVLQVGANDDAALTDTGIACMRAFLDPTEPPCRETVGPLVGSRMAATAPKVETAVRDVRAAMSQAGYARDSYTLVMASYAAPITEKMLPLQGARGCPHSRDDAAWGRTVLFPALSATLRGVAERTGARFLDMVRATEGYEACTRTPYTEEWQRRITVDARALVYGGLDAISFHLAQESFHPQAKAHSEMGRCVGEFVRTDARAGACVAGTDGRVGLDVSAPA